MVQLLLEHPYINIEPYVDTIFNQLRVVEEVTWIPYLIEKYIEIPGSLESSSPAVKMSSGLAA